MKPGRSGLSRLLYATRWSLRGLRAGWAHEAAFRQEVLLLAVLLPASVLLARDTVQWLLLILPLLALLREYYVSNRDIITASRPAA